MMKKLFFALFSPLLFTSCSNSPILAEAEAVVENHPDSTLKLLSELSPFSLDREGVALYNLLLTQAQYKVGQTIQSDSMINLSINFFSQSGDKKHLGIAHYYKACILYQLDKRDDAMFHIKEAEKFALDVDDELLKCKVYERLTTINERSHNFELALEYAKLFIQSSRRLNDSSLICLAYNDISTCYYKVNMKDSSILYHNMCMQIVDKDTANAPYYYSNHASDLIAQGNYDEAEVWLCKAIELKPMPNQYVMLGRIAHSRGDTALARQYWEKALTFNDYATSYNAYNYLANLSSKRGNYQEAMRLKSKSDSVLYAYSNQNRVLQLAEIQQRYDKSVVEKNLAEEKVRWLCATVVGLVVIIILLVFVLYYKNKVKTYQDTISENVRQINDARLRISLLENSEKDYTEEINIQRRQLDQMHNAMNVKLGRGKETYEALKSGRGINVSTKEQEQDLVDYFAFTFYQEYTNFCKQYKSLSLRHLTYLILYHHMGMSDKSIAEVLSVTQSTVRNYRQRTKR